MKKNGKNDFFEKFENIAPAALFVSVITLLLTVFGRMGYCYVTYPGEEMEINIFTEQFNIILITEFSVAMIIIIAIVSIIATEKIKKLF